jgi:hypothetical protein
MPVESTNMVVVLWDSPHFDNYFKYDHSFETIQDALKYSETEYDCGRVDSVRVAEKVCAAPRDYLE